MPDKRKRPGSAPLGDPDDGSESNGSMTRRRLMQVGGAGLVGAALPASMRSVAATPSNLPGSTTINLGDEGLSPGEDVGPYFDQYADHDTNLVIPGDDANPPQYDFDRDLDLTYEDAALVGDGMVELVRPDGSANTFKVYAGSGRTMLANITVRGVLCECDEKSRVRAQSGGTAEIRNVRMPDGGYGSSSNDVGTGWYVKAGHAGTALFCDCYVEGFPDNAFYASVPGSSSGDGGKVVFDGCKTKNNNVSGIRVGSDNSVVKNCAIVNDAQAPRVPAGREMRGLRIKRPGDDLTIENLHITNIYEGSGAGPAIEIDSDSAGGSGSFSDVYVENDSPDPVVERETTSWTVTAESNVHITGENTDDNGFFGSPCVGSGCTSPDRLAPVSDCGDGSGGGGGYDHHLVYEVSNGYADVYVTFDSEPVRGQYSDGDETITDNGDGTWTVLSEHLGGGYRDSWEYDGSVVDYAIEKPYDNDGTVTVWRDGTQTTFEELVGSTETLEYTVNGGYADVYVTFDDSTDVSRGSASEDSDTITTNEDGTVTVFSEHLGNGYADSWDFDGHVIDYRIVEYDDAPDSIDVTLDGNPTTFEELVEEHLLYYEVHDGYSDVSFTAKGYIEHGPEAESPDDSIVENADHTVTATSDHLGNGYADSWYFSGDVVDYSHASDVSLYVELDGNQTTFDEITNMDL